MTLADDWLKEPVTKANWRRSKHPFTGGGQMKGIRVDDQDSSLRAFMKPGEKLGFPDKLLAFERIGFCLGHSLGLPIPPVQLGRHPEIVDLAVCISLEPGESSWKWESVRKDDPGGLKSRATKLLNDFVPIVAFDAWLGNTDRNNVGNIIVAEMDGISNIYSIDYSHSMIDSAGWENSSTYTESPLQEVQDAITSPRQFDSIIDKIFNFPDDKLDQFVDEIPLPFLDEEQKRRIRDGLKARKVKIKPIMESWWMAVRKGAWT